MACLLPEPALGYACELLPRHIGRDRPMEPMRHYYIQRLFSAPTYLFIIIPPSSLCPSIVPIAIPCSDGRYSKVVGDIW